MSIRSEIVTAVSQHLGNDATKPGAILYNGLNTLCASHGLYIMGLNPGGDPDPSETVMQSLSPERLQEEYCSYEDECWRCWADCQIEGHRGNSPHQIKVKQLAEILGYNNIREVFAVNAIFFRSKNQGALGEISILKELFEKCWPVHQMFMSIVQPEIILCLGNGEKMSAFSLLKQKLAPGEKYQGAVKEFMGEIPLRDQSSIRSRVIGVRHPSYPWFNPVKDLKSFLERNHSLTRL